MSYLTLGCDFSCEGLERFQFGRGAVATLTTIDGRQITFTPSSVEAVADHDAMTGAAVTCVFWRDEGDASHPGSGSAFMTRIKLAKKLAKKLAQLTRANGSPVWISGAAVSSLRAPLPGEYVADVKTVLFTNALVQGVKETPEVATANLNEHGGDL